MRLYLVRHGEAGRAAEDSLRELTARGRADTLAVCQRANELIAGAPATLLVSPYARALQTAEIVQSVLFPQSVDCPLLTIAPCLTPDQYPETVATFVDTLPPAGWPLVMVGRQPLLGEMLAWLTDRPESAHSVPTSSISAIDLIAFARGCGTLQWQLAP